MFNCKILVRKWTKKNSCNRYYLSKQNRRKQKREATELQVMAEEEQKLEPEANRTAMADSIIVGGAASAERRTKMRTGVRSRAAQSLFSSLRARSKPRRSKRMRWYRFVLSPKRSPAQVSPLTAKTRDVLARSFCPPRIVVHDPGSAQKSQLEIWVRISRWTFPKCPIGFERISTFHENFS